MLFSGTICHPATLKLRHQNAETIEIIKKVSFKEHNIAAVSHRVSNLSFIDKHCIKYLTFEEANGAR